RPPRPRLDRRAARARGAAVPPAGLRVKAAILATAIVIAAIGACGVRVVVEGRRALAAGDAALAEGRVADAIAGWETAARWYLPFAPHVDEAYERLILLADKDHRSALAAWRAVRSAALATRG